MKKCKRNVGAHDCAQKGITLISLIITIVLMLILVTITVNVVIDGGLFEYAGNAKYNTEIASEKDTVQKAVILAESLSKTGRITVEEIQSAINKVTAENTAKVMSFCDSIIVKFDNSQRYYQIDNNQKIEGPIEIEGDETPGALDGTGTEDDPYVIMSIEDLVYTSQQTLEARNSYDDKYIILGRSLDFNSELSYENYKTTEYDEFLGGDGTTGLKEQLTNGNGFRPIGGAGGYPQLSFHGNFNGNNNTIYNIKVKGHQYAGVFGVADGAAIGNLTVSGSIKGEGINNNAGAGGIVGFARYDCKVYNCYNYCSLNLINITAGGIVGKGMDCLICECGNFGEVLAEGKNTGGILGALDGDCTVINSYNSGKVHMKITTTINLRMWWYSWRFYF